MDHATKRSLALGAISNWAAFAATLAVSFFLAPYLVRGLGDARYGVWCVVEGILAYFTLFDLGIAACLVRFVARYRTTGEHLELNRMVSSSLTIFLVAAGCVLILGAGIAAGIGPGLNYKLGGSGDVTEFMLLMVVNLALTLPLSIFPTILDGLQRFGVKSIVRMVFLIFRVLGIVVVMETQPSLLLLAVVFTITNLLEHLTLAILAYQLLPGLQLRWRFVDRDTLRRVRGYSLDAFLAMLAGRITVQSGAIIVGGFVGVAAAAHYAIASRLVELAKNLLRSATTTLTPAVSQREANGDLAGVRQVLIHATRWVLYLVMPIHLGLLIFGGPFLNRWIGGAEYAQWCYPTMAILSSSLTIGVAQSVASRVLYGLGKLRLFARLALLEAGLNLGLSLVLVGPFGLEGIAFAVAASNIVFCLAVILHACSVLELSLVRYLKIWIRPTGLVCMPAVVWLGLGPVEATWIGIGVGIVLGLIPYTIAVIAVEFGSWFKWQVGKRFVPTLHRAIARG